MRTASPELLARIAQTAFDATVLLKITRTDGIVKTLSSYNRTIIFEGHAYIPGYTRTAIPASDALNVNRFDITGFLDDKFLDAIDIRAGRYDDARVTVILVDPTDLSLGGMVLGGAVFGQVTMENPVSYRVEVASLSNRFAQQTGELYGPNCPAQYGDARCKLTRLSYPGVVNTVITDRRKFTATATATAFPSNALLDVPQWQPQHDYYMGQSVVPRSAANGFRYEALTSGKSDHPNSKEPTWPLSEFDVVADFEVLWQAVRDDYFKYGRLLWVTGANAGFGGEIKQYNGVGTFETFLTFPFTIAPTDTFLVEAGDDKKWVTCKYKFDNLLNFRGIGPYMRGERQYVNAPDSTKIKK